MSELEPTITELEPTATERLRALLDERGEYYKTSGNKTWWGRPIDAQTGKPINVFHNQAQPMGEDRLLVELQLATPEQAIAATLGSCNCSNSERTSDSDATAERRGDAVEVVRCRDCRHYRERINGCVEFGDESRGEYANVEPDGFCAWGRKVDE